jgi:hypothetical protein
MNRNRILAGSLTMLLLFVAAARAQEKKAGEESAPATQLKLQVVLNEMDGNRKIGSFPYVLHVPAAEKARTTNLRLGLRVPIATGGKEGAAQIQYADVGTDIDCTAQPQADGRYKLWLIVERSSVYTLGPGEKPVEWTPGEQVPGAQPVFRHFSESFNLSLRDGQTMQATFATDPLNGHTLTLDVTVNVEK